MTCLEMHPFWLQVFHCLHEILELCNSFSSLLHQREDLSLSADDKARVERIAKVLKLLHTYMCKMAIHT